MEHELDFYAWEQEMGGLEGDILRLIFGTALPPDHAYLDLDLPLPARCPREDELDDW
jgi:hypothetical protein